MSHAAAADLDGAAFPVGFPVVALVTSAGGLNAVAGILEPLPDWLPAAVLVVQHLSPSGPALLARLLDGRTALPVRDAVDGDRLRPGVVFVAPAGSHLLVTSAATLGLIASAAIPPARPSADLLLATLAVTCGPRALAVVLTGHGHDAQAGIRAVHRCGGTVFAQDRASAEHPAMPAAAIATGLVHAEIPLADLAAAILAHLAGQT